MTVVRVEPSGVEIPVAPGETLMAAATRAGYRWPTVCGGQAECGVCAFEVVSGGEGLAAPGADEAERLAALPERRRRPDGHFRLACRVVPVGGLVVRKRGVVRA